MLLHSHHVAAFLGTTYLGFFFVLLYTVDQTRRHGTTAQVREQQGAGTPPLLEPSILHPPFNSSTSFHWDDLDLSQKGKCGLAKCFFLSVSNHTEGYLVAGEDEYDGMKRASELAQLLQRECQAKHLYLELAQRVERVTPEFVHRLNSLIDQPCTRLRNASLADVFNANETVLVVQKVLIAPKPSLFFGAGGPNWKLTLAQIEGFRSLIPDMEAFLSQVKLEKERIRDALHKDPTLWHDFQGLVDLQGNFYFIDLDGHYYQRVLSHEKTEIRIRKRLGWFQLMIDQLATP
jgi:hypothetical protein